MKIYKLHKKQQLPISKEDAWEFLSDPNKLKVITPDHLGFKIVSGADRPMYQGQIIEYTVSPIKKFKMKWVTEITHVKQGEYFVDEQRFGPYSLWHHKHFIKEVAGGIEMEDLVHYKIPMGWIGQLANTLFVKKQLTDVFNYREEKLRELFGQISV